jgi:putative glutamine amidotransferase
MKPIIGLTRCSTLDDYIESVIRAGGEPLVLETDEDPAEVLTRIDGLLLTGGPDVDPGLYGDAPHPTTDVDAGRDAFEIPLARQAMAQHVPLFAICRGAQVLNVAAGGSLVQDIPSAVDSDLPHSVTEQKDAVAHPISVAKGSRLAGAMGFALDLATCGVNSRHHQSVAEVAPSLVASAHSPDGVVEAIERPDAAFCLGVQWHPENFWRTGRFAALFDAFLRAARQRAEER